MIARFAPIATLAALLTGVAAVLADPAVATSGARILDVKDRTELGEKFCAADPKLEHIVVLPAALFVDSEQLICPSGPYKLYRIVEHDDTDDFEYFIDPPSYGKDARLGCDGKAGRSMKTIAVNCRPLG